VISLGDEACPQLRELLPDVGVLDHEHQILDQFIDLPLAGLRRHEEPTH
jgi:hypothetical protein